MHFVDCIKCIEFKAGHLFGDLCLLDCLNFLVFFTSKVVIIIGIMFFSKFLAAMSSSRSDVVTQCVRVFVRVFVPFFSFIVLGVLSSVKVFQWCFKSVSRMF